MKEPFNIYDDFYNIDPKDYMGIIRYYESNTLVLDNRSGFKDKDDFNNFIIIHGQYVISLESLGKYSKAIKYADKTLFWIESKKDELDINLKDYTVFWSVLTCKGRAHYYLKDYNKAIDVFKKLLSWDSNNDNFINWLNCSKSKKRNSINKYLYGSALVILIIEIFFGNQFGNPKIKIYISTFGLLLFFIALINEHLFEKIKKWTNNE